MILMSTNTVMAPIASNSALVTASGTSQAHRQRARKGRNARHLRRVANIRDSRGCTLSSRWAYPPYTTTLHRLHASNSEITQPLRFLPGCQVAQGAFSQSSFLLTATQVARQ